MDGTSQTHLVEPLLQRLAAAVEPNGDVVKGRAQARRDPVARLVKKVGTPDHFCVFGFERRQQFVHAGANCRVHVVSRVGGDVLDIYLLHCNLPSTSPDHTALVIDDRARENAPKPAPHRPDLAEFGSVLKGAKRKPLQHVFGFVLIAEALTKKRQEALAGLNERATDCRVRRLGGIGFVRRLCVIVTPVAHRVAARLHLNKRRTRDGLTRADSQ